MNDTGRPEEADDARPRNAGEVMTTNVIAVGSDEPVRNIARLLPYVFGQARLAD